MGSVQAVVCAAAVLVGGALLTALTARRRAPCAYLALACVTGAGALTLWGAALRFLGRAAAEAHLAGVGSLNANLLVSVDDLSALFLLLIAVISFLTTLYSTAYMRIHQTQSLVRYYPILLLFFAGIIGVVTVRDWFFFLVFWEFMTVCSYFLVVYDKENPVSLRAGLKYLVVTHVATILMAIAIIVLWHTAEPHSFSFAASGEAMKALMRENPVVLHVLLALWLIGFATKAGILPFGDWLPDAYPAAPSGATAAFAGTMTKLGIYGLLRIFVDLFPSPELGAVWGVVIAFLGTGSIFVGTLTALRQDDAKRMMSFSVIGQIGYMFLGIGMGIHFLPTSPKLALIALMAGLFHLLNDAVSKSLLFCTAGSLEYRAGTRNLNHMGGLSAVLPVTATAAGIGTLAVAGIPLFNGFASKWLIYEVAVIGGIQSPLLLLFLLFGITAIFISLVTLAAFLKYLGAAFLGQPSAQVAHLQGTRQEVPLQMQVPQMLLALCCVAFGLFPLLPLALVFRAVTGLGEALGGMSLGGALGDSLLGLSFRPDGVAAGVWNPMVAAVGLLVCVAISQAFARLAHAPSRVVPVWYGGEEVPAHVGHFEAHGMYEPFRRAFERVYVTARPPRGGYPVTLARVFDVDSWLYGPLVRAGARVAERFSRSHVGIPQWYLVWQVVGVAAVLAILFSVMR